MDVNTQNNTIVCRMHVYRAPNVIHACIQSSQRHICSTMHIHICTCMVEHIHICSTMHIHVYPFFQYWCSVCYARHQLHYFTFSTRCTLNNTYCQHMSRGQLCLPIFRGSGPTHPPGKKNLKPVQNCSNNSWMPSWKSFCHILSCSPELPWYTYTCLLIIGGKSGVSSAASGCTQYA